MPDILMEAIAATLLQELQELREGDPVESITRAQAMMIAATGFLTRLAGPEIVAAQLRADADLVASFVTSPDEPAPQSAGVH